MIHFVVFRVTELLIEVVGQGCDVGLMMCLGGESNQKRSPSLDHPTRAVISKSVEQQQSQHIHSILVFESSPYCCENDWRA
jgi:hypothetical protein